MRGIDIDKWHRSLAWDDNIRERGQTAVTQEMFADEVCERPGAFRCRRTGCDYLASGPAGTGPVAEIRECIKTLTPREARVFALVVTRMLNKQTTAELLRSQTAAVGRRVMPEVRKAFAVRATRFEGFKIACYDAAEGGHFRAHRDNLSPPTEHRRFALTLNLNEGYEGGHLRFREFGAYLYRPGAGGTVVFSGCHLHEALPVTRGKRYVLLSFLFGEGDRRPVV